jgi:choline kinase
MVWTLFSAAEELEGDVIVSYGDIVYSKNILQALLNSKADIAVTIDEDWENYWRARNEEPLEDAETLKLRKDGTISEIGQKPKALSEIEGQYMGLMKFSSKGLRQMKEVFHRALRNEVVLEGSVENAYMTDILQALINSNQLISAVLVHDEWVEVDTVNDLELKETIRRVKSIENQLKV